MKTKTPPVVWQEWDKHVQEYGGGILQSHDWSKFQEALGREVVFDQGDGWLWSGAVRRSKGLVYLICSYGPVAKDHSSAVSALKSLFEAGKRLKVDFVRVEPQSQLLPSDLKKLGGRKISEFQAEHTLVLDLTKSEEELRHNLASGHRNLINGTERRGISFRQETNERGLKLLVEMLKDTGRRAGVSFFGHDYFKKLLDTLPLTARLYIADVNGEPVAAALAYDWGGARYYAHAGAFQDKNRQAKASVSLVWQMILDAKAAGLSRFDLWGVSPNPEDSNHKLAGVSRFKRAFGGEQVDYLGTWDIPLKPLKYKAYQVYRALRGMD